MFAAYTGSVLAGLPRDTREPGPTFVQDQFAGPPVSETECAFLAGVGMTLPAVFTPMLATPCSPAFDSPDHIFEVKWDGVRTLAFCEPGSTRLFSRTGREVTHQYPEFSSLHEHLRVGDAVFDGEIVALDLQGRPSFELLQKRINLSRPADISRGVERIALDLVLFDQVFGEGEWRGNLPLSTRLEMLETSVTFGGRVLRSEPIPTHGKALFEAASARGLEGIVAKQTMSPYLPGKRTKNWLKIKTVLEADFVIGGWTPGLGGRGGTLGALLAGVWDEAGLLYVGSVGTGLTEKTLVSMRDRLIEIETPQSPFLQKGVSKGARWARPELVCRVEYRELTQGLKLRAPSFKGLRPDKAPEDCRLSDLL